MAHRMQIQVRFQDTDALGHLNNAAYASYAELARLQFLRGFEVDVNTLILASLHLEFRRQVRFGDAVEIETEVGRVGTSSVTLNQRALAEGQTAADIVSVVVYFDYRRQRAVPIPDGVRAELELGPS